MIQTALHSSRGVCRTFYLTPNLPLELERFHLAVDRLTPASLAALQDGSLVAYAHSLPSGHVTGATTLLGTIAVCLGARRSRAAKAALAAVVAAGVGFVAFLALYSQAHIFGDVLGGMVLGAALVALGTAALLPPPEDIRRRRPMACGPPMRGSESGQHTARHRLLGYGPSQLVV